MKGERYIYIYIYSNRGGILCPLLVHLFGGGEGGDADLGVTLPNEESLTIFFSALYIICILDAFNW